MGLVGPASSGMALPWSSFVASPPQADSTIKDALTRALKT
ncbi:MAG: hypothetical protein H6Q87_1961 [candidate division NC10 bacterium]|nr:hypothetical protein [candidate division NC10 bacterium]